MIMALVTSTVSVTCFLEGAICAISVFTSRKMPSKRILL